MSTFIAFLPLCGKAVIQKTSDFEDVKKLIQQAQENTYVFLDVDDTLTYNYTNMFAHNSPYRTFLNASSKILEGNERRDFIVSDWLRKRQAKILNPEWPEFLEATKKRGVLVYGLTQMESGKLGFIQDMGVWRFEELKSFGITFSPTFLDQPEDWQVLDPKGMIGTDTFNVGLRSPARCFKGCFMSGAFGKDDVVRHLIQSFLQKKAAETGVSGDAAPYSIIFIDDREDHVEKVGKVCDELGVPYNGVIFRAMESLERFQIPNGLFEPVMQELQRSILEERWEEDEEIVQRLLSPVQVTHEEESKSGEQ